MLNPLSQSCGQRSECSCVCPEHYWNSESHYKIFQREPETKTPCTEHSILLCETRWSAKYKSIRLFAENYTEIHKQLKHLALHNSNANGRQNAHNLRTASETPVFIVTLHVIAQYSSILEPATQALQSVHVDMLCVKQHVEKLFLLFDNHRKNAKK